MPAFISDNLNRQFQLSRTRRPNRYPWLHIHLAKTRLPPGLVASGQHALIWIATSLHFETTARRRISRVEQGLLVQARPENSLNAWIRPNLAIETPLLLDFAINRTS